MVTAWHGHGMARVNQTRSQCVNQMGKTYSKPLAARHSRGTAWARHAMCESAFNKISKEIKVVPVNAMKVNGEGNVQLLSLLTSALDGR